jgi:tRNA A37 threonylcarbamoyltransferase TsaD
LQACIDDAGVVLGEAKHSQQNTHLMFGGIIPPVAQAFHRKHILAIVEEALERSNLSMSAIDAIAVTNRPGNVCKVSKTTYAFTAIFARAPAQFAGWCQVCKTFGPSV